MNGIIIAILIICLYFLPSIAAFRRGRKNKESVLVVNIFLGWTLIGWVVALAMAVGSDKSEQKISINVPKEVNSTPAHELEKLAELKEKGIISQEDFEKQKQKILN